MNFRTNALLLALAASIRFSDAFVTPSTSISAFGLKPSFSTVTGDVGEVQSEVAPAVPEPERWAVYINNISFATSQEDLKSLFGAVGTVLKVGIPKNKITGETKGFAFLDFATEEEANKAIESFNGQEVNGRNLNVSLVVPKDKINPKPKSAPAPSKRDEYKAYIGNLAFDISEEALRSHFSQHGTITDLYLAKDKETGSQRGFGFVTFESDEELTQAIAACDGSVLQGRVIGVSRPLERGQKREKNTSSTPADSMRLYIGNLGYGTTEDSLTTLLSQYGPVDNLYVNRDKQTGVSKGFAFVTMNTADAEKVIAGLNEYVHEGRTLKVTKSEKAVPKKKLYIGNLSYETDRDTLMSVLEKYGTVRSVYMPSENPRGFAFVTLDESVANTVINELDGAEVDGRNIVVKLSELKSTETSPPPPDSGLTKLYIGNLSFYTPAETLTNVFSEFGEVVNCFLPVDKASGGSRGFGFITMKASDAAIAMSEMDGAELDGRFIQVNESVRKT